MDPLLRHIYYRRTKLWWMMMSCGAISTLIGVSLIIHVVKSGISEDGQVNGLQKKQVVLPKLIKPNSGELTDC